MSTRTNNKPLSAINLEQHLSETDRHIVRSVAELSLLTGAQLRRLYFEGSGNGRTESQRARRALLRLTQLDVLARLERRIGGQKFGSETFCYRLSGQGQRLHRWWQEGVDAPGRLRPEPGERFIRHRLAVSEVYVSLIEATRSRADGDFEVFAFEAEPHCWRKFDNALGGRPRLLKPDAFFQIGIGEFEHWWFCEIDLGTVSRRARESQANAYRSYWRSGAAGEVMPRVLWLTSNELVAGRARAAIRPSDESNGLFRIASLHEVATAATTSSEERA